MSRQKVPDDKRQRTAQACDYCKRRKQKCNGAKPCSTCLKKAVSCTYSPGVVVGPGTGSGGFGASTSRRHSSNDALDEAYSSASPPKRRHIETSTSMSPDMQRLHEQQRINYHSHSNSAGSNFNSTHRNAASSSPQSQPKAEVDPKSRFKLGPMAPVVPPSAAPRTWSSRKKAMSIELEPTFLQTAVPLQAPGSSHNFTPTTLDSARLSTGVIAEPRTRASSVSGPDEEAVMFHTSRMLQDQKGRLLYVGDSATLSFLHLFRTMVEKITGESSFTNDPSRGNIYENAVSLPPSIPLPCMLPNRTTADVLIESYFVNTNSLILIFDRREFEAEVLCCYADPLRADNRILCLLNLVMAIGLILSTPEPGTLEYAIVRPLRDQAYDQAEIFFRSAKCLANPLDNIEESDFWSVQALSLITVYMLAASRRNAAYTYHGMAVRSAIAVGLHRSEAMVKLPQDEIELRCNIWKSLYVLDRFIAAALGRPTAISDNDCTDHALKDSVMPPQIAPIETMGQSSSSTSYHNGSSTTGSGTGAGGVGTDNNTGFDTVVRSCRIIGVILRKMYARRRVSSRVTFDIAKQCRVWQGEIGDSLRWKRAVQSADAVAAGLPPLLTRAQNIAILHVNLMYCYGVILLTRPFFLFLVQIDRRNQAHRREFGRFFQDISKHGSIKVSKNVFNDKSTGAKSVVTSISRITGVSGNEIRGRYSPPMRARSEKFAENCIVASYHTIAMIHQARTRKYLPKQDPLIIHFLFTAVLLILCNEFTAMYHSTEYRVYLEQGLELMTYFAEIDAQARRLIVILHALSEVVDKSTGFTPKTAPSGPSANSATDSTSPSSDVPIRVFRSELPESFIPGVTDPIDMFFPHEIFGGLPGPFVHRSVPGGQGPGGFPGSNNSHASHDSYTPAEMTAPPGSAPGQTPLLSHLGDLRFPSRQSVHDPPHPGLPSPMHHASTMGMTTTSAPDTSAFHSGANNAQNQNQPVLPPPYAMSGVDFPPQGPFLPQPQSTQEQFHSYQQQHLSLNGMPGNSGLGPDVSGAMADDILSGEYEGTDSMETDGEGFDFEILWDWPSHLDQPGSVHVDTEHDASAGLDSMHLGFSGMGGGGMVPMMSSVSPQGGKSSAATAYDGLGDVGREGSGPGSGARAGTETGTGPGPGSGTGPGPGPGPGTGDMTMKQGPGSAQAISVPLPPMYQPYGMVALPGGVGDTGLDMSGSNVHGMLPLNVPLYATAELG
ncbi:hypothetical protein SEPCBS57363_000090 [Sporothrix epigloea]|uniref:Zn(2)-C6 fungal-type domain-containing protein n=1 Tax=Sporothrix epigloea TaxID=1892477 RepID=A0ABP0D6E9_9PEZI